MEAMNPGSVQMWPRCTSMHSSQCAGDGNVHAIWGPRGAHRLFVALGDHSHGVAAEPQVFRHRPNLHSSPLSVHGARRGESQSTQSEQRAQCSARGACGGRACPSAAPMMAARKTEGSSPQSASRISLSVVNEETDSFKMFSASARDIPVSWAGIYQRDHGVRIGTSDPCLHQREHVRRDVSFVNYERRNVSVVHDALVRRIIGIGHGQRRRTIVEVHGLHEQGRGLCGSYPDG